MVLIISGVLTVQVNGAVGIALIGAGVILICAWMIADLGDLYEGRKGVYPSDRAYKKLQNDLRNLKK